LLVAPILVYEFIKSKEYFKQKFIDLLAGFSPAILWFLFSLLYYGFPFPNTAYAKLNNNEIHAGDLIGQGFSYLLNSLNIDPVTLLVIFSAIVYAWFSRKSNYMVAVLGIIIYLFYTVKIGADFMSGRFLSAAFLMAIVILVYLLCEKIHKLANFNLFDVFAPFAIFVIVGLLSPFNPIVAGANYSGFKYDNNISNTTSVVDGMLVADERGYYYQYTGLLRVNKHEKLPYHPWYKEGLALKEKNTKVERVGSVGFSGYAAGPTVHIVDWYGLVDPILARIKGDEDSLVHWRPGHIYKSMPCGYEDTLETGDNNICDSNLKEYYNKIMIITRDPLFSWRRIKTIIKMNFGGYNHLIKEYERLNRTVGT
jgi:arabinofuranosyltransferase